MAHAQIKTVQDARKVVTSFVDTLSASTLLQLAKTLERAKPDSERVARNFMAAAQSSPLPRKLAGGGLGETISVSAGKDRLDAIGIEAEVDEWAASELLGAGDMAARVGVARTSLDNWRRVHKVLALRKGVRNYVYPVRQFDRRGPVEGLDTVRAHFGNDEAAWEWLVTPNRFTSDAEPIERLRGGKIEEVVRAAEGALDYQ